MKTLLNFCVVILSTGIKMPLSLKILINFSLVQTSNPARTYHLLASKYDPYGEYMYNLSFYFEFKLNFVVQ